jgi:hypothetical protein
MSFFLPEKCTYLIFQAFSPTKPLKLNNFCHQKSRAAALEGEWPHFSERGRNILWLPTFEGENKGPRERQKVRARDGETHGKKDKTFARTSAKTCIGRTLSVDPIRKSTPDSAWTPVATPEIFNHKVVDRSSVVTTGSRAMRRRC